MGQYSEADIERHLKRHTARSKDDYDAVATLESFFRSGGRLHPLFERGSTEPNTDGRFELVPDPSRSEKPVRNFFVQIKGTNAEWKERDGFILYRLRDLAFPAYILKEVTLDPGLLIVVFGAGKRGQERVFWKYLSPKTLGEIDFSQDSAVIAFSPEEELKNTDESVAAFAEKLEKISEVHSFIKLLDNRPFSKEDAIGVLTACNGEITEAIDRLDVLNDTRDNVSRRMLTRLDDLCTAALLLHAVKAGFPSPDLRLAWDVAVMDRSAKYLCTFLRSLRYIGRRIPEEGQTERLMLRYYHFLWQIRASLSREHRIDVLENLERFPRTLDRENEEYLRLAADAVDRTARTYGDRHSLRYYIGNKLPFFIGKRRYFELTLELAGKYASKFNRITVYTDRDIPTNYAVSIAYAEAEITVWDRPSRIKVVTGWTVSIDPIVLNRFAAILGIDVKLNARYREYRALMSFLTQTGMNLLDLIDIRREFFDAALEHIYGRTEATFKKVLLRLKEDFSESSALKGRNTVRYLLLRLREENVVSVLAKQEDQRLRGTDLRIQRSCYPFETNPLLYNLPTSKLNARGVSTDVLRAVGLKKIDDKLPYIRLKNLTEMTGQIYFPKERIGSDEQLAAYNGGLSEWDKRNGLSIGEENGYVWIEAYERDTMEILRRLSAYAASGNAGQARINEEYLKNETFRMDDSKREALKHAFVETRLMLIYGAAGTGKTTLMNFVSNLMGTRSKLFIAKTHTATENLRRRITAPGPNATFTGVDKLLRRGESTDYDVVFVDECSTIDNRTMRALLEKLSPQSLLVLAGDIYQIESIDFGNWFGCAKEIVKPEAIAELTGNWRTELPSLQSLWDEVRIRGPLITEKLVGDAFSEELSASLFEKADEDEIVLCLNYDGRFGLNNINNYFQDADTDSPAYIWHEWRYKVGDRILFNECRRFPKLYNNLKGAIAGIEREENKIVFTVDVNENFTSLDFRDGEAEFVEQTENGTRIRFAVYEDRNEEDDADKEYDSLRAIVPFQLAYAVSIHKSQGLEYDSVKVVIPSGNRERISHGVFYTAITRARRHLKIYWSSETMTEVLKTIADNGEENKGMQMIKEKFFRT